MGSRAAIFIQRGVDVQKQAAACLAFISEQRWNMLHMVPYWAPHDAIRLVQEGAVDVVVTAFDSEAAQAIAADVAGAGQVIYVHPRPTTIDPPPSTVGFPRELVRLVLRWARRGVKVEEIADRLEEDTGVIRRVIRRGGRGSGRTD